MYIAKPVVSLHSLQYAVLDANLITFYHNSLSSRLVKRLLLRHIVTALEVGSMELRFPLLVQSLAKKRHQHSWLKSNIAWNVKSLACRKRKNIEVSLLTK